MSLLDDSVKSTVFRHTFWWADVLCSSCVHAHKHHTFDHVSSNMTQQNTPPSLTLDHITSIYTSTSVDPSDNLSPIMPQMSIVDQEKAKEAVSILLWAPQLTVQEAMILEDFTKDEANTKSMQRKVVQSMPMKAKKASLTTAHMSVSIPTSKPFDGVILNKDGVSLNNEAGWDEDESAE